MTDATKRCVIECENGQRIVADHVIVTASLGKGSSIKSYSFFYLRKKKIQADPHTDPSICGSATKNMYTFEH